MRDFDHQRLRERIEGLPPVEALGVALEAYDALRAEVRASIANLAVATGLQPTPALVLLTLWEAQGRIVEPDAIGARCREAMGCHLTPESVRTAVKRIRAAVPGITIITHARMGYRLPRTKDQRAPWETDQ